eukprot:6174475-Pleurochrysis_carterae.AAC.3
MASFTSLLNKKNDAPRHIIRTLHSDNAEKFWFNEFSDFLATHGVHNTTCPPHVHQLNDVAERAILSIIELKRSSLASSGVPIAFWDYAVTHAVDILNRTCGPPNTNATSYELLTGIKPRIMSILPFGCRAFPVKPRTAFSKTKMDARAWLGIKLGRSVRSPGAYNIWVPSANRVVKPRCRDV